MYYGLQNFYQNHRRYVMSRSDAQLLGRNVNVSFLFVSWDQQHFQQVGLWPYGELTRQNRKCV